MYSGDIPPGIGVLVHVLRGYNSRNRMVDGEMLLALGMVVWGGDELPKYLTHIPYLSSIGSDKMAWVYWVARSNSG
jgi:hypothetical protein